MSDVESAVSILNAAQKVHDEAIKEAEIKAAEIVERAESDKLQILSVANRSASETREAAEEYARELKVAAEKEARELEAKISLLRQAEAEYRGELEAVLAKLNAVLFSDFTLYAGGVDPSHVDTTLPQDEDSLEANGVPQEGSEEEYKSDRSI